MSTKMWKHEGKWRFMATLGKNHRAVLQVPFDADESEAQAIVDAEVDGVTGIPAIYHPWEVKEEKKPKAAVVEWEHATTSGSREFGKPEAVPSRPSGDGWEPIGGASCLLPANTPPLVYHFYYWKRPKP